MKRNRSDISAGLIVLISILNYATPVHAGRVAGSAHDFTTSGWSGGEICVACHTPHSGDSTQVAQLWNHSVTSTSFTMYSSPALDAISTGQPGGISRLCLSCHDGTVGVDSFGGASGATFMSGTKVVGVGGNLSDDHPISIRFDSALALADGSLHDPTTTTVTVGVAGSKTKTGTIEQLMLVDGTVQCTSCHDVHNNFTAGDPLLRISTKGSQLCLSCHDK
ncbi:MAG: cytochrome c3 family protein [Gammaproteobacteria bacterium]|nr:cytochrome c3 family protein [Gammaproteobacteria bacterium]MDH5800047.1 cytochrome c3 family protein [Gammaproteobacteria bacterium]